MDSDLLVNAVLQARELVISTWDLPGVDSVLHNGPEPVVLKRKDLPCAIMELDGGVKLITGSDDELGTAAMETGFHLDYFIWYVGSTKKGASPDLDVMIAKLRKLQTAFMADRKLGRTISTMKLLGMDFTGTTRNWPVFVDNGVGAMAGYVGFRLMVVEGIPGG